MKSAAISAIPYRTQAVRDLAWACFSGPLLRISGIAGKKGDVTDCGLAFTTARRRWLERLDSDPTPLFACLDRLTSPRLGLYYERLWQFFLEQDPAVELLAHNLPVRDRGRTLGEFDVIYWCHERQHHFHLELAVKFYLAHRAGTVAGAHSQWREWLGPNSRDRLDLKLEQLLRHQTRLGDQPRGRAQLAGLGIAEFSREIAIKGYLFQCLADPLPPPPGCNSPPESAKWLPQGALEAFLAGLEAEHFLMLPKSRWLSPAVASSNEDTIGRSMLAERIQSALATTGRALLIAGMDHHGKEQCRFFVTANEWPAHPPNFPPETS